MPSLRSAPRISALPVPVGTRTRLAAVEFVAELAGLFKFFGIGGGVAFSIGIARGCSFAGGGALESGLQVPFAEAYAGGEAIESSGGFSAAARGGRRLWPRQGFIEFRFEREGAQAQLTVSFAEAGVVGGAIFAGFQAVEGAVMAVHFLQLAVMAAEKGFSLPLVRRFAFLIGLVLHPRNETADPGDARQERR